MKLSTILRKSATVASIVAASTLTAGLLAPSASAGTLVPQMEGEIKLTNLDCIVVAPAPCIDTTTLDHPYKVTSLLYDDNFQESRLFVDLGNTANNYGSGINFSLVDAGTNPEVADEFWFRPVAIRAGGTPAEGGRLEVGRFRFDFLEEIKAMELSLRFFDVEDPNFSGILEVNGVEVSTLLPAMPDGSIQTLTLNNVNSFVVQLGKPGPDSVFRNTGDGVLLQIEKKDVPEPGTIFGLGALAATGALGLRKRNTKADA